MGWQVTLNSGLKEVALPNGLRYQGAAEVVLSDDWYGQLSANSVSPLFSSIEQLDGDGDDGAPDFGAMTTFPPCAPEGIAGGLAARLHEKTEKPT
jgi:hypothetical protein